MRIRVTKIFTFEMAHALKNYDGLCRNIHGHSYTLYVTVSGEPVIDRSSAKLGMVVDFGDLKKLVYDIIINRYDHALLLQKGHENELLSEESCRSMKILKTDFQPTSEMMVGHFAEILIDSLPHHLSLEKLKLYETANSYAEWLKSDQ